VGKPEGKRPLGRPRRRGLDSIKIELVETGCCVDWIGLAQDRGKLRTAVNAAMNLRVSENVRKLLNRFITGGLSSSAQLHRVNKLN
jgi:hypothetical protein